MTRSQAPILLIVAVSVAIAAPPRSVTPLTADHAGAATFDRENSAALFVGVRNFDRGAFREVPYAVDDAIDLAHLFAFDSHVGLVPAHHVILALAGVPEKQESRARLDELRSAGARVTVARPDVILNAVREQAARAGRSGLLVVSFATHGFVARDGSQQLITASGLSVSKEMVIDIIDEHRVARSLILIDACKERMPGTRGAEPGQFATQQLTKRMPHALGQVVLSTVKAAYDDPARRNGVFSAAVIDGLQCNASAVRDQVTAQTLSTYIARRVRTWIRTHVNRSIGSVTQISSDDEARNMPLAHCGPPLAQIRVIVAENSMLRIFTAPNRQSLIGQRDVGFPITHTAQADGTIVAGTRHALFAFNDHGTPAWSIHSTIPLQDLTAGDVFRKHHHDFVALWGSQIAIYSADGHLAATGTAPEPLHLVAIFRTTTHHAPRIVVASAKRLFLFDPKKLAAAKPVWSAHLTEPITSLKMIDHDRDSRAEIAVITRSGAMLYVDVKGHVVAQTASGVQLRLDRRR